MAVFNKYHTFVEDVGLSVHNLNADVLKLALTDTAPNAATHGVLADIVEIAPGNGYDAGGKTVENTGYSQTGGTGALVGDDVVWTATGNMAQFEHVVLYNSTQVGGPLIGWWTYPGGKLNLVLNETFTVDFGATILTLT